MKKLAQDAAEQLRQDFEWLHAHPELSYEERETTAYLRRALEQAGIPILDYALETGVVAEVRGAKGGPVVALRADIDALPVQEACALPYRSQNEGVMHACGHDFHAAVLLAVARLLNARRETLPGTVRLIFQPGEEAGLGAEKIMATPAMDGVRAVFGLHTSPLFPAGVFSVREGAATASVNRFEIRIHGVGAHAAYPEKSADPIVAGAAVVTALQTIVSRNVSPLDAALVSVTHFEAGNTWNVIPGESYLEGTVRTASNACRALIRERIEALAKHTAEGCGVAAEVLWHAGPGATDNAPALVALMHRVAEEQGFALEQDPPSMLGDDFALYQEKAPGVYFHAGIGLTAPNHNPLFCVDETALAPAAEYTAALAEMALQ